MNIDESKITVISGAGMSHASGIPTFRGKNGLWKKYSPAELANPNAFFKNPKLVWEWYRWRINIILNAQPNSGHEILADIEQRGFDLTILTQNVDDLHERSGSKNVLHFHGEILHARCISCMNRFKWTQEKLQNTELIPKCECGSFFRPDVVWFGESLKKEIIRQSLERIQQTTLLMNLPSRLWDGKLQKML